MSANDRPAQARPAKGEFMRSVRGILVAALFAVPMLVANEASAQQVYSMFGRIISTRGSFIKIPVVGEVFNNCGNFKRGHDRNSVAGGITFKGTGMILKTGVVIPKEKAAPFGCVDGAGMITATAKGPGKAFTFPAPAGATTSMGIAGAWFNRPLPGHTIAVSIPNEAKFPQLATSFRIDGPPKAIPATGDDSPHGKLFTGMNLAPFRKFQKSAWQGGPGMTNNGQTGRAGPNFTWCFGNGGCQTVAQGTGVVGRIIVKYHGGPNRFGGTMTYVISTGTGKSNLALAVQPGAHKTLVLLALAGMGHQPTGRGYADKLTDRVKTGPIWAKYKTMSTYVPEIMYNQPLITMVTTRLNPLAMSTMTALINSNYGFPWTTGTVFARATGSTPGPAKSPATSTNTAKGSDRTEPLANNGRIITLVAGGMARTTEGSNTPEIGFLPEPSNSLGLLAGAFALAGVAAWRARAQR
jgi:hypothetical protein